MAVKPARRAGASLAAGAAATGLLALLLLAAIRVPAPARTPPAGPPLPRLAARLLILHLDSLRADHAFDPARMPALSALAAAGASGRSATPAVSTTGPSVKALFSGEDVSLPDFLRNFKLKPDPASSLPALLARAGGRSYFAGPLIDLSFADLNGFAGARWPVVGYEGRFDRDREVLRAGLDAAARPDARLVMALLGSADQAGHLFTPASEPYRDGIRLYDDAAAEFRAATRPGDALFIYGDHGMDDHGFHSGGHPDATRPPFVLLGPSVRRGAGHALHQRDLCPLFAALLGAPIPPRSRGWLPRQLFEPGTPGLDAALRSNLRQRAALLASFGGGAEAAVREAEPLLARAEAARGAAAGAAFDEARAALERAEAGWLESWLRRLRWACGGGAALVLLGWAVLGARLAGQGSRWREAALLAALAAAAWAWAPRAPVPPFSFNLLASRAGAVAAALGAAAALGSLARPRLPGGAGTALLGAAGFALGLLPSFYDGFMWLFVLGLAFAAGRTFRERPRAVAGALAGVAALFVLRRLHNYSWPVSGFQFHPAAVGLAGAALAAPCLHAFCGSPGRLGWTALAFPFAASLLRVVVPPASHLPFLLLAAAGLAWALAARREPGAGERLAAVGAFAVGLHAYYGFRLEAPLVAAHAWLCLAGAAWLRGGPPASLAGAYLGFRLLVYFNLGNELDFRFLDLRNPFLMGGAGELPLAAAAGAIFLKILAPEALLAAALPEREARALFPAALLFLLAAAAAALIRIAALREGFDVPWSSLGASAVLVALGGTFVLSHALRRPALGVRP